MTVLQISSFFGNSFNVFYDDDICVPLSRPHYENHNLKQGKRKIKQSKKFKWTFTVLHIVISVCINLAVKKRKFFKEEFPVIVYDHSLYGYYLSLFPPKGSD